MSDSSFPFQGTQVADGPAGDFEESRGNRRTVVALVVVGVLVVAALAYFFLFAGGDDPVDDAAPVRRAPQVQVTPEPSVTPAPVKAPKVSRKAIGKDPFEPLVEPPAEAVAGGGATGGGVPQGNVAGPGGNAGQPPVNNGNTGGNGNAGTGNNGNGNGNGGGTSDSPLTVKVVSVAGDNTSSRVQVGTKTYSVAVGDVFGTYFKTLRLKNGKCGSFTYGDERFDLCEGETARMQ